MLLRQLPEESALRTEIRDALTDAELARLADRSDDAPHGPWSREGLLLAAVFDAVQQLNHTLLCVNASDASQIPAPTPLRRPGVTGPKRAPANPDAIAFLSRIRDRHEAERAKGG